MSWSPRGAILPIPAASDYVIRAEVGRCISLDVQRLLYRLVEIHMKMLKGIQIESVFNSVNQSPVMKMNTLRSRQQGMFTT